MLRRITTLGLSVILVFSAAPAIAQSSPDAPVEAVPQIQVASNSPETPDRTWIVQMARGKSAQSQSRSLAISHGADIRFVYRHVINGFAFTGSDKAVAALQKNPNVISIEPSRGFNAVGELGSNGLLRIDADATYDAGDRGTTADDTKVRIFVLDTGIMTTHTDLAPNLDLSQSLNCIDTTPGAVPEDGQGHGSHVAAIAAAADQGEGMIGVASQAKIVAVKVLDDTGYGTDDQVLCGLERVAELAVDGVPTVVNLSLGDAVTEGPACSSSAMHQAICNLTSANVTVIAAAGNDSVNAAGFVPASYPETIAVSGFSDFDGTRSFTGCEFFGDVLRQCDDALASFSNFGAVVDVTAPGVRILAATLDGGHGLNSGTSMAAPHVAGLAALILAENTSLTPTQVRAILQSTGECPDGTTAAASSCAGHGQWLQSDGLFGSHTDPDGIPEPLVNAPRAVAAARFAGSETTPPVVTVTSPVEGATYEAGIDVVTASYSCTDADSGIMSCSGDVANGAAVDTSTPGVGLTFTVVGTDNALNSTTVTTTYDVLDTTAPVITLVGDDPLYHIAGDPFTDPGAQVTDNADPTTTITGVSTVDPTTPGSYTIAYDYTDAAGIPADQVVRSVEVTPPPNGSVVVTGDNAVEVFVNGVSLGSSDDWKQSSMFRVELAAGDVVAVHGTDAGGIAAMLAEVSWDDNTAVSDASWKVSATAVADWETKTFNDTGWAAATSYGAYGVAPWSTNVTGFSTDSTAEWIWTADNNADNDVYLRFTIATPATPPNGSVVVTGDNAVEVFVNGVSLGSSDDWRQATAVPVELATGDVIAVHATDAGGIAAMLAEVSWDDNTAVSDASWKVSTTAVVDWETKTFNDTGWAAATSYGTYGIAPWLKNVTGFSTDSTAEWIWTSDNDADNDVYLRYTVAIPVPPPPPPNGSVVVTGDNAVEVFVNGVSVGSSDDWTQSSTFLAELALGDVVAVHGTDAGGIAAMLAEVSWDDNTAVSDASWKVSTTAVADWETKTFNDTGWAAATSYGTYGIAPWLKNVTGFSTDSTAEWIWSADNDADNDVYLRYTVAVPVPPPPPPNGSVVVTGDNAVEVFVNGVSVGSSDNWKQATAVPVELATGDVIAVHATDAGGIAGFLAQIEWDGNTATSDSSWKVATAPVTGWATKTFDDTGWAAATSYGTYGIAPWLKNVAGFPTASTAEWIWTTDSDGDNDVYLRYRIGG